MNITFESFRFSPDIMAGIREFGSSIPTSFQFEVIPLIMQGNDIIGMTRAGDGKTAAFVLPVLQRLSESHLGCIRVLILTPVPERAEEIHEVIDALGNNASIRSVAIYDGAGMDNQKRSLRSGYEIVVACPGRLLQHVRKGSARLSGLEVLVLDDADSMADEGCLDDIQNILECLPDERQTLLFTATMTGAVRQLIREIMHNPVTVEDDGKLPHAIPADKTPAQPAQKNGILSEFLGGNGDRSILVFTRGRQRAGHVAQLLGRTGYRVALFRGTLVQQPGMTDGTGSPVILLAGTHTSSKNIDIAALTGIINSEIPDGIADDGQPESRIIATGAGPENISELEKILAAPLERLTL